MTSESAQPRTIILGVTGGIAAYKAADLARLLLEGGSEVQVVMTAGARRFVTALTFAALTQRKVITELFSDHGENATLDSAIEHIRVAREADLLLVAPATADILAKFAAGIADDFLTATHLAFTGPVIVAPAMNTHMWNHPATRENVARLRERGVVVVEPESGPLACGMRGPGRLADLETIADAAGEALRARSKPGDLDGETVLLTAGPTREALDPVRYISNRSSGKMGLALAEEALARGARVIVVSGPVDLSWPPTCEVTAVLSAAEMHQAVLGHLKDATVVVAAAAVADDRPVAVAAEKIKKRDQPWRLDLEPTPDILAEVGRLKGERLVVGFAAETEKVVEGARRKLAQKNCDIIVANPVGTAAVGGGFDSDENQGWILDAAGGAVELPRMTKRRMAERIFDRITEWKRSLAATRQAR